jgi:hypothetical protein
VRRRLLEEAREAHAKLKPDLWLVDKKTRYGIYQSLELPSVPCVEEMIASLKVTIAAHTDPEWADRRKVGAMSELELYDSLVGLLWMAVQLPLPAASVIVAIDVWVLQFDRSPRPEGLPA